MTRYNEHLIKNFDIKPAVLDIVDRAEEQLKKQFTELEDI